MERYPQGRLKVFNNTKSVLEWVYTWPKSEKSSAEDARLILNMAIVWHYLDQNLSPTPNWAENSIRKLVEKWMVIPANFMLHSKVERYSRKLFAAIFELLWSQNLSIVKIREFEKVFAKAALDLETARVAGYLKLAAIKTTIRPELLIFNGSQRKIPTSHFSCSIFIVIRSKATKEDISNFFAEKNNLDNKVRFIKNGQLMGVTTTVI